MKCAVSRSRGWSSPGRMASTARRKASRRGQPAEQGPRRGDHGRHPARRDAVESHRLLGPHHQRGLGLLIGSQRGGREIDHLFLPPEEPRRLHPDEGVGLARHHHQERPAEVPRQDLAHPRRRRHRQAHHVPKPLPQGLVGRTTAQRPGEVLPRRIDHGRESNASSGSSISGCRLGGDLAEIDALLALFEPQKTSRQVFAVTKRAKCPTFSVATIPFTQGLSNRRRTRKAFRGSPSRRDGSAAAPSDGPTSSAARSTWRAACST